MFISEFRSDTQELTSHSNSKPGNSAQAYDNQNEDILASELDINTIKSKVRKKVVSQNFEYALVTQTSFVRSMKG